MKRILTRSRSILIVSLIFFLFLMLANTETNADLKTPDLFNDFDVNDLSGCSCHNGGSPIVLKGNGTIDVALPSFVEPGNPFSVNLTVRGFTEAADDNITIGFRYYDADNNMVIPNENKSIHQEDYPLNSTGYSVSVLTLSGFLAPGDLGNYSLEATAIRVSSDIKTFYYLKANATLVVSGAPDTTPPQINFVKYNNKTLQNGTTLSERVIFEVNATDDVALKRVRISYNELERDMEYDNQSSTYKYTLDTYLLKNGPLTIIFNAVDSSDNTVNVTYNTVVKNEGIKGDINSYKLFSSEIIIGDGVVDSFWENVEKFDVIEYSSTSSAGYIKSLHDDYYIYFLIGYSTDKIDWIAIEFEYSNATSDEHMVEGNDGFAIGTGQKGAEYFGDIYYVGDKDHPEVDTRNDYSYEIIQEQGSDFVIIELKRPLNTNDLAGHDIVFEEGKIYNVRFASSKPAYHKDGERQTYTLALTTIGPQGVSAPNSTETSTTSKPIEEIKLENQINFVLLNGFGLLLNAILIVMIIIFYRKK